MKSRRGKRIAWWITGVGLLVMLACGVAFRDRAVEQYWLWKLESDDIEEQKAAAENLAEMGSVRAVPVMLQKLRGRSFLFLPYEDMDGDGDRDLYVRFRSSNGAVLPTTSTWRNALAGADERDTLVEASLRQITKAQGSACVSYLVNALAQEDLNNRHLAAILLGEIGPDAVKAIPALTELLQEKDETIRQAAAEALKKIQSHEEPER